MKNFTLKSHYSKMLADVITPVSIYLKLRDNFANSILLESSDYHGSENSYSYVCCNPIATFSLKNNVISIEWPDKSSESKILEDPRQAILELSAFMGAFTVAPSDFKFITSGLFGYVGYDAVQYFEDIKFSDSKEDQYAIPDILYTVYRNIIVIDHFKNEMYIFDHLFQEDASGTNLQEITDLVRSKNFPDYRFKWNNDETSNVTDAEFLNMVSRGKDHCHRGDVFQIVLSRRFHSGFQGDEFNVYRSLRSVNPSPYLFYFDYGSFKIFGSSPEAQIVIKDDKAIIYPIAGTFRRTGNDQADAALAQKLSEDEKETSEHVMLVDLARNDLSRNGTDVRVETFKEIQYYSHVIHLVSKVVGKLEEGTNTIRMVADTFPAGTLSGAPKHKAMELIDRYENTGRGYYGGAIGFLGFNGEFNHAIMIRSFLSKNNTLYYQAGAGVVAKSREENELQEVNNKLAALRTAIEEADKMDS
ncbi:MAG: anthranilate synthase component I family protein [Cytophagales bacterium]|nr:anthranilate synthase component I family protein [Cytophagales bacterium]